MKIYPQLLLLSALTGSCLLFDNGIGAASCDEAVFVDRCDGDIITTCESGFVNHESCAQACVIVPTPHCSTCGNSILEAGEECDGEPFCRADCTVPRCGDGILDAGEVCDSEDGCSANCSSICGDGTTQAGEACDDSNTTGGDGCRADCLGLELCGDNLLDDGEACDDGDNDSNDGCSGACLDEFCGDGVVNFNAGQAEACDDANVIDGDGCDSNCTLSGCNNGIASPAEVCLFDLLAELPSTNKNPTAISIGDIDGANGPDIAFTSDPIGELTILFNDGNGSFSEVSSKTHNISNSVSLPQPVDVALGDIDGDGDLDAAAVNLASNEIVVALFSNGGQDAALSFLPGSGAPIAIKLLDLNSDQKLDIATVNRQGNSASIFLQGAANTFAKVDVITGDFPLSLDAGDIDGDGDIDIITANRTSRSLSVLLNNGAGVFAASNIDVSPETVHAVVLLDEDLDGKLDVFSSFDPAAGSSKVLFRKNVHAGGVFGAASLNPPQTVFVSLGPVTNILNTADMNKQAPADLLAAELNSSGVGILFDLSSFGGVGLSVQNGLKDFAAGDLNQDGALDLVGAVQAGGGFITVALSNP